MIEQLILSKFREYFKLKGIECNKKTGKLILFSFCPFTHNDDHQCAVITGSNFKARCPICDKIFNLLDVVRELEDMPNATKEEVIEHLSKVLKLDNGVTKKEQIEIDTLLNFYEKNGWSLLAISPNSKIPIERMKGWSSKEYRNKDEWNSWIINQLNLAARTGKTSNMTVLDIDVLLGDEKKEFRFTEITKERKKELLDKRETGLKIVYDKLKDVLGEPLIQKNLGGEQLIYQYDPDFPKTTIDIEGIHIDVENDGGYILIEPSKLGITTRKFKELKSIPKMPDGLKKILKEKVTVPRKTQNETIKENINTENFKLNLFEEGTRNSSLVKLGGVFRKQLNLNQTKFVLHVLNNHNHRSGNYREIEAMANSLDCYIQFDEKELAHEILEHVKEVKEITKSDLELSVAGEFTKGEAKKRLNKTLQYLIREGKITQKGKKIRIVEDLNWTDTLLDIGTPVDFKVPYFQDYAYFCKGDIILIGSKNAYGKSTLAMNIVKRLVDQKIKPYYVYNEKQGGRFAKTATHLGLREGDFYSARCGDPDNLILKQNSITIYDWVRPNKFEGFARTDLLFDSLVEKTELTDSFLICFVQLKADDSYFAPNQIGQYPSLLCRYLHETEDGIHTKFVFDKVRDSKLRSRKINVPCIYDWEKKTVKMIEELTTEEQEQIKKQRAKEEKK